MLPKFLIIEGSSQGTFYLIKSTEKKFFGTYYNGEKPNLPIGEWVSQLHPDYKLVKQFFNQFYACTVLHLAGKVIINLLRKKGLL